VYKELLKKLKDVNPKAIVIVGGVHPTVKLNDFINDMTVDYIVQGEGEVALANLLTYIKKGVRDIPRIHQRQHVKLDSIPFIDRNLWDDEYPYKLAFKGEPPFVTIVTSRACTKNCSFCQPCSRLIFGNDERRRSVANVIAELEVLDEQYHFKSWMIHDDGFLQNIAWVQAFIETYKTKGFGPRPLIIQCRSNYIVEHPELIRELRSVLGLELAIVGFESGSDKVLKIMRKGTTAAMNIKAADVLHENGVKIFANILFGVPGETNEDVDLTMDMVKRIKPEHFSPASFSPYPGSELHDYCKKNQLIVTEYADRHVGAVKIRGIDYDYIGCVLDAYNKKRYGLKYALKQSKNPVIKKAINFYKAVRR
jgi:radical SAM superfamily enzyme YgiQ (UPF0313 family)